MTNVIYPEVLAGVSDFQQNKFLFLLSPALKCSVVVLSPSLVSTSESDSSRDLSPAKSFPLEEGSRGVHRFDLVRCFIVLENGSTITVNVFLRLFFDDVASASKLLGNQTQ